MNAPVNENKKNKEGKNEKLELSQATHSYDKNRVRVAECPTQLGEVAQ